MEKNSRAVKAEKNVKPGAPPRALDPYRRFIPDARPMTQRANRHAFWTRIWLSFR